MKQVFALLLFLSLPGCSSVPNSVSHDIPNFRPLPGEQGIYRGGQPHSEAGWAFLQSIGVSNIVKLNLESEKSDGEAKALGMKVSYFPINTFHQWLAKPDRLAVSNAVAAIKPGTYIHCRYGRDRTGLIVACKRVWQDGWAKTNAWNEMIAHGFAPNLRGLSDFWRDEVRDDRRPSSQNSIAESPSPSSKPTS